MLPSRRRQTRAALRAGLRLESGRGHLLLSSSRAVIDRGPGVPCKAWTLVFLPRVRIRLGLFVPYSLKALG